jgi:hypothetical protein
MKKFNINHTMYVQITAEGWEYLHDTVGDEYIKHCIESRKVKINGETWYELQCWGAFDVMPPNFGSRNRFMSNVMFKDNELEHVDAEPAR